MEYKHNDTIRIFDEEVKINDNFHLILLTNDESFDTRQFIISKTYLMHIDLNIETCWKEFTTDYIM